MNDTLATGQTRCYDATGGEIRCAGSGQDAEWCSGVAWPDPRFVSSGDSVQDRLTGLFWTRDANIPELPMTWAEALAFVADMNLTHALGCRAEFATYVENRCGIPPSDGPPGTGR